MLDLHHFMHVTYIRGSVLFWRRCDNVIYFWFYGLRHIYTDHWKEQPASQTELQQGGKA